LLGTWTQEPETKAMQKPKAFPKWPLEHLNIKMVDC
jgi:hypothetical protein